jgi:hypothetical protein
MPASASRCPVSPKAVARIAVVVLALCVAAVGAAAVVGVLSLAAQAWRSGAEADRYRALSLAITAGETERAIGWIHDGYPVNAPPDDGLTWESHLAQVTDPPLAAAAKRGDAALVAALLDAGADRDHPGCCDSGTALHRAAIEGHIEVVRLLLARGAAPEPYTLQVARERGHHEVVQALEAH